MKIVNTISFKFSNRKISTFNRSKPYILSFAGNLFTIILHLMPSLLFSQSDVTIEGKITDEQAEPIIGATVRLSGQNIGTISNIEGYYRLVLKRPGVYKINVSSIGFETKTFFTNVKPGDFIREDIILIPSVSSLNEVIVRGKSEKLTLEAGSLSLEAIELGSLKVESSDVAAILNRTAGVNIRQSAGLGSPVRININGLQGKAITFFRDGTPTDYLGNGFNIALLPANSLERIDVYKGVLPISLGADALGGALNFVSKRNRENTIELSHEVASYQTHRSSANVHLKDEQNHFIELLSFFNYSENNYPVDVQIRDPETRNLRDITADRFHDTFLSAFGEIKWGVRNGKWAEEFSVSGGFSLIRDDIQHSLQMLQAFGRARQQEDGLFGSVKYMESSKDHRLNVSVFGALGRHTTMTRDTALQVFNWLGEVERKQGFTRGEVNNGNISLAEFTVTELAGRATVNYRLADDHQLIFNNVITRKRRKGNDPVGPRVTSDQLDPLTVPASLLTNISGLEWKSFWLNRNLLFRTGIKNYYFKNSGIDFGDVFISTFDPIKNSGNLFGANAAIKYIVNPFLLIKGSYEYATRIPEEDEIYGDGLFLQSNPELTPERSHNLNIGIRIDKTFSSHQLGYLELNAFARQQRNLIFVQSDAFSVRNVNGAEANAYGAELDLYYDITDRLTFNGNVTFQDIRLATASQFTQEYLVGERIPDIPYFFFNTGLRYRSKELWEDTFLTGFIYQNYVEKYFLFFRGSPTALPPVIPSRNIVRLGVTTTIKNWSITTESNNVFDAKVFENYREQRPGRTWHLKVNYQMNL
ncbi:MAG: TonB-dependent receptor [Bacteroidota bacterium]